MAFSQLPRCMRPQLDVLADDAYDEAPADAPARLGYVSRRAKEGEDGEEGEEKLRVDVTANEAASASKLKEQRRRFRLAVNLRRNLTLHVNRFVLADMMAAFSRTHGVEGSEVYCKWDIIEAMPDAELKKKWSNSGIQKLSKKARDAHCIAKYGDDCFVDPDKPAKGPTEDDDEDAEDADGEADGEAGAAGKRCKRPAAIAAGGGKKKKKTAE